MHTFLCATVKQFEVYSHVVGMLDADAAEPTFHVQSYQLVRGNRADVQHMTTLTIDVLERSCTSKRREYC